MSKPTWAAGGCMQLMGAGVLFGGCVMAVGSEHTGSGIAVLVLGLLLLWGGRQSKHGQGE